MSPPTSRAVTIDVHRWLALAPLGRTNRRIQISEYKSPVVYGPDLHLYSRFIEEYPLAIDRAEVASRFAYHQPSTQDVVRKHDGIRELTGVLAEFLIDLCPESRELSLALTNLDQVCMWANAAVARHQ